MYPRTLSCDVHGKQPCKGALQIALLTQHRQEKHLLQIPVRVPLFSQKAIAKVLDFYSPVPWKKYIIQYYHLPWVTTAELWFGTRIRKCQAGRWYCPYLAVRQPLLAYHAVLPSTTQIIWKNWREIKKSHKHDWNIFYQTRKFKQLKIFILQKRFGVAVSKCY